MQAIPFTEARAHLADVLHRVEETREPLLISRRGQGAAVLMSLAQYQQLTGSPADFLERLAHWRADNELFTEEEDPFANLRSQEEGRSFSW